MSRRKGSVHHLAQILYIECSEGHRVGMVVLQRAGSERRDSPYMIGEPLERIDGPEGETKVLAVCPTCRKAGSAARPQIRWDRLQSMLAEMENNNESHRTIPVK
jgi:hypothetical protein